MIELFGDWILFDGRRLVELPAGIEPALRMRLEAHLHAEPADDGAFVDLSDLIRCRVLVDTRHRPPRILGQQADAFEGEPAIPDDTEIITVVNFKDVTEALTGADIGFDE